ncbi:hypothetical protein [Tamlana crocina]|uniref:Uncharacterized protein n=1 Tax=Tamlana crocina TaxID=393006 RepID=A0ABX1DEK4_9FLAO|nr:hypothetical protein [Tamlana crocina]NJX15651.1 hypothetical protein [Tamlana crocina]
MKKTYALVLCSALFLNFSCSKDNKTDDEINGSLSVEEGKTQLEDNSIALLNKVEDFKNDDALNDIVELAEYLSSPNASKPGGFKKTSLNTISNLSGAKASKNGLSVLNAKQAVALVADTPLADDFEAEKGVYQWNSETEDFDKTGESDDIVYNISYNGNTAVFSFTDFSTTVAGSGDNETEAPTLAKANLKINNNTVFTQEFTALFNNGKLMPVSINNTTTIGAFIFNTSFNNTNNTSIEQAFDVKIDNESILGYNYTVNGNFNDEENIEDKNAEDVVDNASLSLIFLNAKLMVTANDTGLDSDQDLTIDEQIDLLNNNTSAVLSVNNKSVASLEFYKDQDTYTHFVYNQSTQQYEETEVTEDIVNARFLFGDETSSDFETYFDGSFTSTENKFESVFDAYEALFADVE